MRCYLVAGEISGDRLGAGLMTALKKHYPDIEFRGLGGEQMQAAGLTSLYPLSTLSIMGLVEVLAHLPRLFRVRHRLYRDALDWQADVFIGIDAPDFNLGLEKKLREKDVKTVHYVSPSVWAWREGRVKGIAKACDLMLAFLPFEAEFYRRHQVPVAFVGHPLADSLPLQPDTQAARTALQLDDASKVIAMLPGSRQGEVKRLLPDFLATARLLSARYPAARFVIPAATESLQQFIQQQVDKQSVNIDVTLGQASDVMTAADVVLLASGTATLEAMLLKRPMVVAYRLSSVSHAIMQRLLHAPYVALPNILAGEPLVPELLQDECSPARLAQAVARWLDHPKESEQLKALFAEQHQQLRRQANKQAAEAVVEMMESV